jgi:hypothetical protein
MGYALATCSKTVIPYWIDIDFLVTDDPLPFAMESALKSAISG